MRKVIFGASVFFSGVISVALLFAGSMASDLVVDGGRSSLGTLTQFGLLPALLIFAGIAIVGLVIGLVGMLGRERDSHREHHHHHHEHWEE